MRSMMNIMLKMKKLMIMSKVYICLYAVVKDLGDFLSYNYGY
jgi:hypothetical protein